MRQALVDQMRANGVNRFIELGPGRVLSGLVRRIDREAETAAADSEAKLRGVMEKRSQ